MRFKQDENKAIWEAFGSPDTGLDFGDDEMDMGMDDGMGDDFDMGDDPDSVVMSLDTSPPVETMEPANEVLVSELKKLAEYSKRLYEQKDGEFEDWMVAAITVASTYVSDVWHRLDAKADFANTGVDQAQDFQNL